MVTQRYLVPAALLVVALSGCVNLQMRSRFAEGEFERVKQIVGPGETESRD